MKPRDVEIWALRVLEQISTGGAYETALVELKADWTEPQKTARRIAGHANAARGNAILWLIGVDEKRGILGVAPTNLATWYAQVRSEFDHLAPDVTDVALDWGGLTIFALAFETDRSPYVVKNPRFGQKDGGSVRFEVPWRQGTSVESATRSQLLLILAPAARLPLVEVLEGQLAVTRDNAGEVWNMSMLIYVTPVTSERVAIAAHRIEASHRAASRPVVGPYTGEMAMLPMGSHDGHYAALTQQHNLHPTIRSTNFDLTIDGPGLVKLIAKHPFQKHEGQPVAEDRIGTFVIRPAGADVPIVLSATFTHQPRSDWQLRWLTATYSGK
jgi:hypothetical protein